MAAARTGWTRALRRRTYSTRLRPGRRNHRPSRGPRRTCLTYSNSLPNSSKAQRKNEIKVSRATVNIKTYNQETRGLREKRLEDTGSYIWRRHPPRLSLALPNWVGDFWARSCLIWHRTNPRGWTDWGVTSSDVRDAHGLVQSFTTLTISVYYHHQTKKDNHNPTSW